MLFDWFDLYPYLDSKKKKKKKKKRKDKSCVCDKYKIR